MASSSRYAVLFREEGGSPTAGALVVTEERLLLEGGAGDRRTLVEIAFADLTDVDVRRGPGDRVNGRSALVLHRRQGPPLHVAPLGHGLLHEIAQLVAELTARPADEDERVAVVVPLKLGCSKRAEQLVADGPPFDPAALGLRKHEVFLHEHEVVFLFTGPGVRANIQRAMRKPTLWHAGLAWRDCIAGRPELVAGEVTRRDEVPLYSWTPVEPGA